MSTSYQKDIVVVTATVSHLATTYASGQQLGSIIRFPDVLASDYGQAQILAITYMDLEKNNVQSRLALFDDLPVLSSTDGTTLTIPFSELSAKSLLYYTLQTGVVTNSNMVSTPATGGSNKYVRGNAGNNGAAIPGGASARDLWGVLRTEGAPVYTGTSSIVIKMFVLR